MDEVTINDLWKLKYSKVFSRITVYKKLRNGNWQYIESLKNKTKEDFDKEVYETRKVWEQ